MKKPETVNKVLFFLFWLILIAGALQIIAYFFYIYKPASAIVGKGTLRLEIPALSQLLRPQQITTENTSLADEERQLLQAKFNSFKNLMDERFKNQNTFIKSAGMDFVIAGELANIKVNSDKSVNIELSNSSGQKITEVFTPAEANLIQASLLIMSETTPTHSEVKIDAAKVKDYIIIKYFTDLIDKENVIKKDVEIFRNAN
jgi:hypothetical protein